MVKRHLNLKIMLDKSSHFLLGARGTGKSYLIRESLSTLDASYIDLLDSRVFLRLQNDPHEIENLGTKDTVVIDEIQRIPELLNEVHRLIESKGKRFLLTGSSARKLRRSGSNLLAGRALPAFMLPFTWQELSQSGQFDLERYLLVGGLPKAYLEQNPQEYLYAYIDTYLKEEIFAEALVRNLANYSRFLEQAAFSSGHIINFTKIAQDAQLAPNTVRDYYQILEDTLLGFTVQPWTKSKKRKAVSTAKFYFFDVGIMQALNQIQQLPPAGEIFGRAFEHFIAQEIRAYLSYSRLREGLTFWRTKHQQEVDFIIGDEIAIEVKSSKRVSDRDHTGLKALGEEKAWRRRIVVSLDSQQMKFDSGIEHLFWQDFLQQLWQGKITDLQRPGE
jgi:predicted AAA+ superfamily ATPase